MHVVFQHDINPQFELVIFADFEFHGCFRFGHHVTLRICVTLIDQTKVLPKRNRDISQFTL